MPVENDCSASLCLSKGGNNNKGPSRKALGEQEDDLLHRFGWNFMRYESD